MNRLTLLALIVGLATAAGLVLSSGPAEIADAMVATGWGMLGVALARGAVVALAGLGWFAIFPQDVGARLRDCMALRFVREGINTLLPVAQVGGDVVTARLLARRGVAGGLAGASMFVDLLTQALSQLLFTIAGLLLLVRMTGDGPLVRVAAGGLLVAAPALAAFFLVQRRGGQRLVQAALGRFAAGAAGRALGAADLLYAGLHSLYARPARIVGATGIHLSAWTMGAAEVWICLNAMGHPIGPVEAMVIESLAQAVRGAAFAIPGALGAQEGGLIALCALFDIPAEAALALSLVKRMADLAVGVPGLIAWHHVETERPDDARR